MGPRPDDLLTVGDQARLAGLTPKAIRHYDRIGVLRAAVVDAAGYRWYSKDQVESARRVAVLRSIDVPLDDVRRCIRDDFELADVLAGTAADSMRGGPASIANCTRSTTFEGMDGSSS